MTREAVETLMSWAAGKSLQEQNAFANFYENHAKEYATGATDTAKILLKADVQTMIQKFEGR
jgi:hypothetical protein